MVCPLFEAGGVRPDAAPWRFVHESRRQAGPVTPSRPRGPMTPLASLKGRIGMRRPEAPDFLPGSAKGAATGLRTGLPAGRCDGPGFGEHRCRAGPGTPKGVLLPSGVRRPACEVLADGPHAGLRAMRRASRERAHRHFKGARMGAARPADHGLRPRPGPGDQNDASICAAVREWSALARWVSRRGGAPNMRAYSRLNWEALS
jgi:hypothetical protein